MAAKEVKEDLARRIIDRLVRDNVEQARKDGVAVPCEWDIRQRIVRICERRDKEMGRL